MSAHPPYDWDARAQPVLDDQIRAYDELRRRCPVARSEYLHWSLLRHADVMRALLDPATFSNAVSTHLSVPNGMDPPRHGPYRRLVERYFDAAAMAAYEPTCRRIADELIDALPAAGELEWMGDFAHDCVLRMHCAFMGWPATLHEPLRDWTRRNQAATLAGDRDAMAAIALDFDGHIRAQLDARRAAGAAAPDDATTRLLRERIDGRALADDEIVSIVRNWTVGELSTMAACLGILAHRLARDTALQQRLREQPAQQPAAIEEMLRIDAPLVANRRVTTREVEVGGRTLPAGARVSLIWASANRDEAVFGDADAFRLDRDPALNLLWGAGIHVCPGAPLARLELRTVLHALLARTRIGAPAGKPAVRARYPAGGWAVLPLRVERR